MQIPHLIKLKLKKGKSLKPRINHMANRKDSRIRIFISNKFSVLSAISHKGGTKEIRQAELTVETGPDSELGKGKGCTIAVPN